MRLSALHFGLFVLASIASASPTETRIPPVQGTTFSNARVNLPEDLNGKVGILVIGFSQGSRDAITDWGKKLADDYFDSPHVVFYEMPVLASVPKMMRGFVTGRIKASVSERGKVHFLPLLDNEMSWRALTHYNKPDDPYIVLIDGSGRVRWQSQGPPTADTYGILKHQVAAIQAH